MSLTRTRRHSDAAVDPLERVGVDGWARRFPRLLALVSCVGRPSSDREALIARVARLSDAGVRLFQLREKTMAAAALLALASDLRGATAADALWLLNGPAGIARRAGFAGVHLPDTAFTAAHAPWHGALVSRAVHASSVQALEPGAFDLAVFAPVFEPSTKAVAGVGLESLATACRIVEAPVFALGGVTPERVAGCLAAGAYGVAVLSGLMNVDDPGGAARAYLQAIGRAA